MFLLSDGARYLPFGKLQFLEKKKERGEIVDS